MSTRGYWCVITIDRHVKRVTRKAAFVLVASSGHPYPGEVLDVLQHGNPHCYVGVGGGCFLAFAQRGVSPLQARLTHAMSGKPDWIGVDHAARYDIERYRKG